MEESRVESIKDMNELREVRNKADNESKYSFFAILDIVICWFIPISGILLAKDYIIVNAYSIRIDLSHIYVTCFLLHSLVSVIDLSRSKFYKDYVDYLYLRKPAKLKPRPSKQP